MTEAMHMLTGMPTDEFHNRRLSEAAIWEKLMAWEKAQYIMTGAVMGRGDKQGLVTGHAYTVLGAHVYNGEKLVKARNPWGRVEYKGKWSDYDKSKWTDAAKKALNHTNTNDGAFFMPLKEFKALFYNVQSAYHQNW